ncbi:histidine phosphatase family protein [Caulobacter soli]|uniref:histidine phosphatase family protein n=1 Tax=Caulobacter soli TaxID=2708539 RepID=UPI0013EDD49E|nr:histidine phosphatase family protein [Caulobacter soli]
MATRLVFLCHAATRSMREGGFPDPEEPADVGGLSKAEGLAPTPPPEAVFVAPSQVARDTAQAMGLAASVAPALADIDHGAWRGRSLVDVQAAEPEALMGWIQDPAAGAPGGEGFASVQARVSAWMEAQAASDRRILAITHQTVMRAALAHVLEIPPSAAFRIDIAPLSRLTLSFNRQWRFQGLGGDGA